MYKLKSVATADLVVKSFGALTIKDAEKGEVEALVANVNVVDRDRDVFLAGSTPVGNRVKLSSYGHDVVKQNAPPAGIGTLVERAGQVILEGRFFLNTQRGREAFETVKALGADGQWSVGFTVASVVEAQLTPEWRGKGAGRLIAKYEPVEASPVFIGAQPGTATLAVKEGEGVARPPVRVKSESLTGRIDAIHAALRARNEGKEYEDHWWAREVFDDHVIVSAGESQLLKVPYTMAEDESVQLGADVVEVEIVYQPVTKEAPAELAPAVAADPDIAAKAADEFARFERTRRTLGILR